MVTDWNLTDLVSATNGIRDSIRQMTTHKRSHLGNDRCRYCGRIVLNMTLLQWNFVFLWPRLFWRIYRLGIFPLDGRMANIRELKTYMLGIFLVAVASIIAMFYYAVNYTRYTKLGMSSHMGLFHNDTRRNRLHGRLLSRSNDSEFTQQLLAGSAINRDQREQNFHQNKSNIEEPNLAPRNGKEHAHGLCPKTSLTLCKHCIFF